MCEPFKKVHIITSETVQGISLNGLVLRYEKYMGLYIGLHSKYLMLLGSEVIWAMDYSTGPIQVVYVEEVQKYHYQAGCITQQGDGNQVVYQLWDPRLLYQLVILSNNQV